MLFRSRRARDRDVAGLERLAQGFEGTAREFRQLVEEQHPGMRQRDLAWWASSKLDPPFTTVKVKLWCCSLYAQMEATFLVARAGFERLTLLQADRRRLGSRAREDTSHAHRGSRDELARRDTVGRAAS